MAAQQALDSGKAQGALACAAISFWEIVCCFEKCDQHSRMRVRTSPYPTMLDSVVKEIWNNKNLNQIEYQIFSLPLFCYSSWNSFYFTIQPHQQCFNLYFWIFFIDHIFELCEFYSVFCRFSICILGVIFSK